jgi:hypothetical protein
VSLRSAPHQASDIASRIRSGHRSFVRSNLNSLERTRGLVFVGRRRESMNLDKAASVGSTHPRAAQLGH